MYRWLFIAVVLLWLTAMAALVRRDVWPAWTAQDVPRIEAARFAGAGREEQFGIFDSEQNRIGTAWSDVRREMGGNTAMTGTVLIEGLPLIPPVRFESATEFDPAGELDSFCLDVYGVPMTIKVHGERRGIYFPCELQVGPMVRQANLEMSASHLIGESFRPFTVLPKLHVGQSWRMQILDPFSAIRNQKAEFKPVVAQVTGTEKILVEGKGQVECFVVEIREQGSKAWVADDGQVLRQEVAVPGLKKLALQAEPYSAKARSQARDRVRIMRRPERGRHGIGD